MITIVNDKQSLLTLLKENGTHIRGLGISKLGVFGSFARNGSNEMLLLITGYIIT